MPLARMAKTAYRSQECFTGPLVGGPPLRVLPCIVPDSETGVQSVRLRAGTVLTGQP
jgi:hypothetical protein